MVEAVVHVLLEPEAELVGVGVRSTGFLELLDVFHTLGGLFTQGVVRCHRGTVHCHREAAFQMEIVVVDKVL